MATIKADVDLVELYGEVCSRMADDGFEAEVHKGYSGRNMFGSRVTGISTDGASLNVVSAYIAEVCTERGLDFRLFLPKNRDNFGLGWILY